MPIFNDNMTKTFNERLTDIASELSTTAKALADLATESTQSKRKIDWSKMPVDTIFIVREHANMAWCKRYFCCAINGIPHFFSDGATSITRMADFCITAWKCVALPEQPTFTPWFGGECPVPDGLMIELIYRNGTRTQLSAYFCPLWPHSLEDDDIIAYRITGLAEGWEL